jgi:hypothetical protein
LGEGRAWVPKNVFHKVQKGKEAIQQGETVSIEVLKKEIESLEGFDAMTLFFIFSRQFAKMDK